MFVVLLGPPGAGKGTQAQRLTSSTGLLHLSTGDMFRENVRGGAELGTLAKSYMDRGELVPDEVTIKMLLERITRPDAAEGAMFDGFPRNVVQAEALDVALSERGDAIAHALLIAVPDEDLVGRLSGRVMCRTCGDVYHQTNDPPPSPDQCEKGVCDIYQRDDDRPEVVRNRIEQQKPPDALIDHYCTAGVLREIDGRQGLDAVTAALLAELT